MKDICPLLKIECFFHVDGICTIASGNELTQGFGYIENIKICPLHKPSNFKSPMGKKKAKMRAELWSKYENMES